MSRLIAWLLAAVFLAPGLSGAQQYPERPVKVIVPYPPGGNTDILVRIYTQKLAEQLGKPVVVENRGGGAGSLGVGVAAKSPNDGYTLVVGDIGSIVVANHSIPNLSYQPQKDFAPISLIASVSIVVTTFPKSPFNSFDDVLAHARRNPGKLTYGSGGIGSPGHLAMELLRSMTGVDILHVPFKGGGQAVPALIGEQVDILVDGSAFGQIRGGRVKALAVTGPRLPALPDTPGIGETVKGYSLTNWWVVLAPVGTPPEAISRLNAEIAKIAADPETRDKLTALGLAAQSSTPQQFAEHLRSETDKVARIVKEGGIKFQ